MNSKDVWKALRKPFPKEAIGTLPKGGVNLSYVGHAAVTDRLLEVDPEWSWEPLGTREDGLPATDNAGNLWIKLTINGVTRIGVGDGKNAKECISDAIRNAAMRFGVALDLWSKEELESTLEQPELKNERATASKAAPAAPAKATEPAGDTMSASQLKKMQAMFGELGLKTSEERHAYVGKVVGRAITKSSDISKAEAVNVMNQLDDDIFYMSQGAQ